MKKIKILLFLGLIISAYSCKKFDIAEGTPECVEQLIKDFNSETDCIAGVDVRKYEFQGGDVYLFNASDCSVETGNEVYDSECNSLGFVGGSDDNQIINGEDFSNAVLISVIWTKQP